jgi:hypothetical protein
MSRPTLITALVLGLALLVVIAALFMEAASGPTFRAEDHDSYAECIRNIPAEWGPGSLQRAGAEDACMYVHGRAR